MLKVKATIEISDDKLLSTSSTYSSLSSPCPSRKDKEVEEGVDGSSSLLVSVFLPIRGFYLGLAGLIIL